MYIFSKNQINITRSDGTTEGLHEELYVRIIYEGEDCAVIIKSIDRDYVKLDVEIKGVFHPKTLKMEDFIEGYCKYKRVLLEEKEAPKISIVNRYYLAEGKLVKRLGELVKISAPLLDIFDMNRMYLESIEVWLARVKITFHKQQYPGTKLVIEEPLNLSRLPKPGKDIINLPQYYIE